MLKMNVQKSEDETYNNPRSLSVSEPTYDNLRSLSVSEPICQLCYTGTHIALNN